MALSVEEYEQEMLRQFNEQDTPRAKAQFLTELYLARQAGMMDENQQSALDRFTVTAITPKRTDGTYDFQAAEDLLSCMADIRMDYSIESGASWQAWQNAQNPADRIHAQNCRFMTEVMGSFMLSVGTDVPQEYADRLDQFGTAHEAYSAARLSEHPEETWRADTETHEKYTERIRRLADARTRERVNTMREEDKASFQLADQVQEDPDLSMSSVRERAVFSLSSDATTQYLTATDQSQLVRDLEQIHDIDTLQEYLTAVSEMPFVKDGVTYRDPVKYLLQDCAAVDRQKDRQQFFSAADGYDARNTTRPIPPELREKVENVIRGMSADIAGRSALKQNEILGSYGSARQARGVGERIEAQKATDEMERITSYNAFQRMDRLYYKMATKDKSGPFHRDSEEYQRMFNAVKAIHDMSENGYDDKDPVARAKMMDLMAKANKAANDYAEKEVYEKDGKGRTKHSALGVARKNSALLILDLTTGGAQPNWDRVADRRPRLGRKAESPSSLIGGERANLTEYQGVSDAACQEGARKLAQKKAQRERALSDIRTAKLREGRMRQEHPQSAEHMKEMWGSLTLASDLESRRTCLGVDPQFLDKNGRIDLKKTAQLPKEQREYYERVDRVLSVDGNSELIRGGMGGLTMLATLKFMQDHPEASFSEAMDPKSFQKEKREAGEAVLSALEKANAEKDPDMRPLVDIVGKGMKLVAEQDLKKEALRFLGADPNLSEAEALEVFHRPENREKMIGFIDAQLAFKQQAYQVLNKPGIKGMAVYVKSLSLDMDAADPADRIKQALAGCRPVAGKEAYVEQYLRTLVTQVPKSVLDEYITADQSSKLFAGNKNFGKYISGQANPFNPEDVGKVANAALTLEMTMQQIAKGRKLGDTRMAAAAYSISVIQPEDVGIQQDASMGGTYMYQSFSGPISQAIDRVVTERSPEVKPIREMIAAEQERINREPLSTPSASAAKPVSSQPQSAPVQPTAPPPQTSQPTAPPPIPQGPPPVVPPSVSATVPLPQAPPPMQPSVSQSVPLPQQMQGPPPQSLPPEAIKATTPKKEEPKSKQETKPKKEEPEKKESEKDGPKKDGPQKDGPRTRPRSRSVHSATDAARQGKYRPAPKPPTM